MYEMWFRFRAINSFRNYLILFENNFFMKFEMNHSRRNEL